MGGDHGNGFLAAVHGLKGLERDLFPVYRLAEGCVGGVSEVGRCLLEAAMLL